MAAWKKTTLRRLISDPATGRFMAQDGTWTDREENAKEFPSIFQALEFCCSRHLPNAELLFRVDGKSDIRLSLSDFAEWSQIPWTQLTFGRQLAFR